MQKVKLLIKALAYSQTHSGAYALRLREEGGDRELPIVIGGFEAQSIAIALDRKVDPPRPLTHDLFKNFADAFGIYLKEVFISKLQDGVFYSSLICIKEGQQIEIDARTSDAVALAIRFRCDIFTHEDILQQAGVILDEDMEVVPKKTTSTSSSQTSEPARTSALATMSLEDLHKLLEEAVADEDYEKAARIRDEIDHRSASK
ncbi:MAG: bifunctional nuclease family protein [Schleiferiaceae bacterium]|nr:bifunctional nuclease family protein [Schleiferiaceae bacterium]